MIEISSLSLTADFRTEPPVLAALNVIFRPESRELLLYQGSHLFVLVSLLSDPRVCSVDVVLKQFVLTKRGCADGAFVGEVGWLQGLAVVLGYVVQQLPLVDLRIVRDENTVYYQVGFYISTFPHTGHRPLSWPLLAASCILAVTRP